MPDEIRVGRPMSGGQPMMAGDMRDYSPRGGSRMPWIVLAVVVIVLVVLGVLFRDKLMGSKSGSTATKGSGYQAVFLTNGQVYFGKLTGEDSQYATLKDIYYLQVTQPPLQGSQTGANGQTPQQEQPRLSLVKLGNELHGPVDSMQINRDQILFFEDMKEDGRVMQAIRDYQKNPQGNQGTQNNQTTPPPANTTPAAPTNTNP